MNEQFSSPVSGSKLYQSPHGLSCEILAPLAVYNANEDINIYQSNVWGSGDEE